jgi:hypothetical protein
MAGVRDFDRSMACMDADGTIASWDVHDTAAETMVTRFPRWAIAHGYHYSTLLRRGNVHGAIDALQTATKLDADYLYAPETLIGLMIQHERASEATAVVVRSQTNWNKGRLGLNHDAIALT